MINRTSRVVALIVVGLAWGSTPMLRAQTPAAPAFEAASIKPNTSGSGGMSMTSPAGRYTAINVTVRSLILNAYDLPSAQILDSPGWTSSEHFDVVAKADGAATPQEMKQMIRSLLVDRFNFAAHTETREIPVYVLTLARPDGKLGPGLRRSDIDCSKGAPSVAPATQSGVRPCSMRGAAGQFHAGSMSVNFLVRNLSGYAGRPVTDRTGLSGAFDIDLVWSPDHAADPPGPSIFTAVQEQLGLKLESSREPKEVLVIDRVERPTPD